MQSPDDFHATRRAFSLRQALNPKLKHAQLAAHFSFLRDNMRVVKRIVHESNRHKLPRHNYLNEKVGERERFAVVDFVHKLVIDLGLDHRVFFTAISLIDRYSLVVPVELKDLEVLALSCIWIASKFHSRKSRIPEVSKLCSLTNGFHKKNKIIKMESIVLTTLNWAVDDCTYDLFIDTLLQGQVELSVDLIKYGALYLCELAEYNPLVCMEYNTRDIAMEAVFLLVCVSRQWMPSKVSELGMKLLKMASNPPPTLRKIYDPSLRIAEYEGVYMLHRFCGTFDNGCETEEEYATEEDESEAEEENIPPEEPRMVRLSMRLKLKSYPLVSPIANFPMPLLPTPRPSPVDEVASKNPLTPKMALPPSPRSRQNSVMSYASSSMSSFSSTSSGSTFQRGHAKRNSSYMDLDEDHTVKRVRQ